MELALALLVVLLVATGTARASHPTTSPKTPQPTPPGTTNPQGVSMSSLSPTQLALVTLTKELAPQLGAPSDLLLGIADHESGLNPAANTLGLDPTAKHEVGAGAFGMTKATIQTVGGDWAAIAAGNAKAQVQAAAALWVWLKKTWPATDDIIGAWWVGPSGLKVIKQGASIPNYYWGDITPLMVAKFVADIKKRAAKYNNLIA